MERQSIRAALTLSLLLVLSVFLLNCAQTSTGGGVTNAAGPGGPSDPAPNAPTNLSAVTGGKTWIDLTWTAATDDKAVTGYDIYRGANKVGTASGVYYSDTGLTAGIEYCYTVKARDAAMNESAASNSSCATPTIFNTAVGPYTYVYNGTTLNYDLSGYISTSTWVSDGPAAGESIAFTVTWTDPNTIQIVDPKETMTWTRTGGTLGDITGDWTIAGTGNEDWMVSFGSDGTWTISGASLPVEVRSHHSMWGTQHSYNIDLNYDDPSAYSVTVTGPAISGTKSLEYDAQDGSWYGWLDLGSSHPTPPLMYTFTINDSSGTWKAVDKVECFMEQLPASPSHTVSGSDITFYWTPIGALDIRYHVHIHNAVTDDCLGDMPGTDVMDAGMLILTTLPGGLYSYDINASGQDGNCSSSTEQVFLNTVPASFSAHVQTIFNNNCIGCHNASHPTGLDLSNGVSYGKLVGVASTATGTSGTRVVPTNSADSVLYQRITGIGLATGADTMPPQSMGGGWLYDGNKEVIKLWIDEGALNNKPKK